MSIINRISKAAPDYVSEPITDGRLHGEFEYLSVVRFAKKLYADGRISIDEFNRIKRKACEKFNPLYPEIRA